MGLNSSLPVRVLAPVSALSVSKPVCHCLHAHALSYTVSSLHPRHGHDQLPDYATLQMHCRVSWLIYSTTCARTAQHQCQPPYKERIYPPGPRAGSFACVVPWCTSYCLDKDSLQRMHPGTVGNPQKQAIANVSSVMPTLTFRDVTTPAIFSLPAVSAGTNAWTALVQDSVGEGDRALRQVR